MMRISFRPLTLIGKSSEDVTTAADTSLPFYSHVDSILPKAADCMVPEVSGQGLVTFVLITPNTSSPTLALLGRTGEEVHHMAIVNLDGHFGFEERIYGGPPGFLGRC